jgi:hypothetical protein
MVVPLAVPPLDTTRAPPLSTVALLMTPPDE